MTTMGRRLMVAKYFAPVGGGSGPSTIREVADMSPPQQTLSSWSVTFSRAPSAGEMIVLSFSYQDVASKASVTTGTWTKVVSDNGTSSSAMVFYRVAGAGESATQTVTWTDSPATITGALSGLILSPSKFVGSAISSGSGTSRIYPIAPSGSGNVVVGATWTQGNCGTSYAYTGGSVTWPTGWGTNNNQTFKTYGTTVSGTAFDLTASWSTGRGNSGLATWFDQATTGPGTFAESKAYTGSAATTHSVTLTAPREGDLVILAGYVNKLGTQYSMTSGTVHDWAELSSGRTAFIASRVLGASPSSTITLTTDVAAVVHYTCMVFRGVGAFSSVAKNALGASQTSWNTGSVTVPSGGLVIAVAGYGSTVGESGDTINNGITKIDDGTDRTTAGYLLNAPSGAMNPLVTFSSSDVAGVTACFAKG